MAKETVRGIDHVGIFVPDIEQGKAFFIAAFGARLIYQSLDSSQPPEQGDDLVRNTGIAPGSVLRAQCVLKLGQGPDIEMFEMVAPGQSPTTGRSDIGLNHFALYADDPQAAIERFEKAGGRMFSQPNEILFKTEQGANNTFCYGVTPWGMNIEFISYPGEMGYEEGTELRRCHRGA